MNDPNVTDWIGAIAALLGIPTIIWGVIKLFIKDKDNSQRLQLINDQLNEFKQQTSEFQHQTAIMRTSNELLEKQISLQTEMLLKTTEVEEKKLELQQLQRREKIKPFFVFQSGSSDVERFSGTFRNSGGTALALRIHSQSTDFVSIRAIPTNTRVETGQIIEISGFANQARTFLNSNQVSCQVLLEFKDVDGNIYLQNITKSAAGMTIAPPYANNLVGN